ncbi:MAG: coenzyme F420-0:L-glutamate ligase/coenzyme F420-1:gamma-L-glutamate ligase, partial [Ilumatobacter sp.]
MAHLQIFGVEGLPEITDGMDLAEMVHAAAAAQGDPLADGDIVLVTSKIVSKAEGCTVELDTIEASPFAVQWSQKWE